MTSLNPRPDISILRRLQRWTKRSPPFGLCSGRMIASAIPTTTVSYGLPSGTSWWSLWGDGLPILFGSES